MAGEDVHGLRRARLVRRKPVFQGRKDGKHVFVALAEEAFLLFLGAVQDDADRKKILVIVFLAEVIIKNDSILFLGLLDSQIFDLDFLLTRDTAGPAAGFTAF